MVLRLLSLLPKEKYWVGSLEETDRSAKQNEFTFTYLHPGKYFLTVVADMDGDGLPSPGDITHPRMELNVRPKSDGSVTIHNLNVRN